MALDLARPYCIPALPARYDAVLSYVLKIPTSDFTFRHVKSWQ
jgi:hypothetical protein